MNLTQTIDAHEQQQNAAKRAALKEYAALLEHAENFKPKDAARFKELLAELDISTVDAKADAELIADFQRRARMTVPASKLDELRAASDSTFAAMEAIRHKHLAALDVHRTAASAYGNALRTNENIHNARQDAKERNPRAFGTDPAIPAGEDVQPELVTA